MKSKRIFHTFYKKASASLRLPRIMQTSVFRLALSLLLVFVFTAVCSLGYVVWKSGTLMDEQIKQRVETESANLATLYRNGGLRRLATTIEERASQPNSFLYLLTLPNGQPLLGNRVEWPLPLLEKTARAEVYYTRMDGRSAQEETINSRAWIKVSVLPGGFRIVVGHDLGERMRLVRILVQAAIGGLLLVVVLGFSGAFLISHRMIKRLNGITRASQHIMAGNLEQRLPVQGSGDEFDQLAIATNTMLERIAELMHELREVGDNIAHDLKTPLTRLRSRAEEALRGDLEKAQTQKALENVLHESDALLATFNAILQLARLEAVSASAGMEKLNVQMLLSDVHELYEPVAEEAGFTFSLRACEPVCIHGNRELLSQALSNLIDNALKYSKNFNGSRGSITLGLEKHGDQCWIDISDNGQGIPADQFTRVLERFVRLERSRTLKGTGLGLSITEAITRYHGGSIELQPNMPQGLKVILKLPVYSRVPDKMTSLSGKAL